MPHAILRVKSRAATALHARHATSLSLATAPPFSISNPLSPFSPFIQKIKRFSPESAFAMAKSYAVAAGSTDRNAALSSEAPLAPVTMQRPGRTDLETSIPKPYMARGLIAPDMDHPNGTPGLAHNNLSVLQQHCAFFDQDDDGIIYPWETYSGFRLQHDRLLRNGDLHQSFNELRNASSKSGFRLLSSRFTFTTYTRPSMGAVREHTIEKEGRYCPSEFENMFSKHAETFPDKLSYGEMVGSKVEWTSLYILARDEEGYLSKEAIRRCFDGSLFDYCAKMQMGAEGKIK
ncbi:hypothetical protein SASPL_147652 [Salvia splendens]|uniref:Peroxygenase n=1 Tax=Salvia splendens TaxID=180675 RepID=A0A8X8WEV6_SALSN|nr:hypothetical protein SASPL_147652 [Salvia splendens]